MFRLWCEWDIGQDDLVFEDSGLAEEWAEEALKDSGIIEGFDTLLDEGLVGVEKLIYMRRNNDRT